MLFLRGFVVVFKWHLLIFVLFFLLLISVSDCQNKLKLGNMAPLSFDHKETAATKFRNGTAYN